MQNAASVIADVSNRYAGDEQESKERLCRDGCLALGHQGFEAVEMHEALSKAL
jgi:hypothetical protein